MNAKRKIALVLAIFYMVSVTGFALSQHFCGGKLASVSFFKASEACSMCKKMAELEKDNHCCKNAKVEIKVKDSHQVSAKIELKKLFEVVVAFRPSGFKTVAALPSVRLAYNLNNAPLRHGQPPLNLLHGVFRI